MQSWPGFRFCGWLVCGFEVFLGICFCSFFLLSALKEQENNCLSVCSLKVVVFSLPSVWEEFISIETMHVEIRVFAIWVVCRQSEWPLLDLKSMKYRWQHQKVTLYRPWKKCCLISKVILFVGPVRGRAISSTSASVMVHLIFGNALSFQWFQNLSDSSVEESPYDLL